MQAEDSSNIVVSQFPNHQQREGNNESSITKQNTLKDEKSEQSDSIEHHSQGEQKKRKRKHKHKHKHRKHSPEYYERRKTFKENRKKENEWDTRFHLGEIPLRPKVLIDVTAKSIRRLTSKKSGQNYATANYIKEAKSKSFNIRVVRSHEKKRHSEGISSKGQTLEKHEGNPKAEDRKKLLEELEQAYASLKYPETHHRYLVEMVENSQGKDISGIVRKEIGLLKKGTSTCSLVDQIIRDRQVCLSQLAQMPVPNLKQVSQGKREIGQDQCNKIEVYRDKTIRVVQAIFDWRNHAEETYLVATKVNKRLYYTVDQQNYLLKLKRDNAFMLKESGLTEDPFLLSFTQSGKDNKQDIVKIRACELLLLEETLKSPPASDNKQESLN